MAILAFQKPDKVLMLEADNFYGKFEFKPLEPGYGITVGNALRRVLLSSLEGYAISSIKIDGVKHEFDVIPGVKEDVTNIILNLKKVDLKQTVEDTDFEKTTITVSGKEVFKAGDIGQALTAGHLSFGSGRKFHDYADSQQGTQLGARRGKPDPQRRRQCHRYRLDIHTDQERQVFSRKLPCRPENRLRQTDHRDYDQRIHPSQGRAQGSC